MLQMIRELLEELTIAVDCNSALTKRVSLNVCD